MKKNQKYGIASIVTGVLLFFPLILAGYAGKGGGSESFFKMMGNFTASGTPTWYIISAVFAIFTTIASILLIANGVSLILNYKTKLMLVVFKYLSVVAGVLGFISAVCAMLLSATYVMPVVGGKPFKVGAGAVILLLSSIVSLVVFYICRRFIIKEKENQTENKATV